MESKSNAQFITHLLNFLQLSLFVNFEIKNLDNINCYNYTENYFRIAKLGTVFWQPSLFIRRVIASEGEYFHMNKFLSISLIGICSYSYQYTWQRGLTVPAMISLFLKMKLWSRKFSDSFRMNNRWCCYGTILTWTDKISYILIRAIPLLLMPTLIKYSLNIHLFRVKLFTAYLI